jgi:hypothetical protein
MQKTLKCYGFTVNKKTLIPLFLLEFLCFAFNIKPNKLTYLQNVI